MKTAFVILTQNALKLAKRCQVNGPDPCAIFGPAAIVGLPRSDAATLDNVFPTDDPNVHGWNGPLKSIIPMLWETYDAIVAVMALGIVVRLFGPLAVNKRGDPAVVAVDDSGRFAIAVLGGHRGGANQLATEIARCLGAQAVITTASDVSGLPSVDLIGREDGWVIENAENLTRVASAVVRRQPVAVWQTAGDRNWWRRHVAWPEHFHRVEDLDAWRLVKPAATLLISDLATPPELISNRLVVYRPPTLVAGIGCKRGVAWETIEAWVEAGFREHGLAVGSLSTLATVMLKVDEPGLFAYARRLGLPLVAFPSEYLKNHPGIETPSAMVRSKVGLSAVAEPAALMASGATKLLVTKRKGPGVTLAVARKP